MPRQDRHGARATSPGTIAPEPGRDESTMTDDKTTPDRSDSGTKSETGKRPRLRAVLRWAEHSFALICLLGIALMFTPIPRWLFFNLDRQQPLAEADFIICLGGDPERVLEATKLLQEGYASILIVSNSGETADQMKELAVDWGAPPGRVRVDHESKRTVDHPTAVARNCGVDPRSDHCIIVTSMTHMARSEAVFQKAGYRHIVLREPRWERDFRVMKGWRSNVMSAAEILYEYTARLQYRLLGYT